MHAERGDRDDSHFGECPECGRNDGYLNAGKTHRFYCRQDRTAWYVGSNLFSSWRDETEAEQRAKWADIDMESFRDVKPVHDGATIRWLRARRISRMN